MKRTKLNVYVFGLMLMGIIVLAAGQAGAVTGMGTSAAAPTWDQTLTCTKTGTITNCPRFVVLTNMNKEAVLDKETGLVWEQSPDNTNVWDGAHAHCNHLTTGGRKGWRLPTVQELSSLVDPMQSNPSLPGGHPFSNVQSADYWSATTYSNDASKAWSLYFGIGNVYVADKALDFRHVWCVRGGQGVDPQ